MPHCPDCGERITGWTPEPTPDWQPLCGKCARIDRKAARLTTEEHLSRTIDRLRALEQAATALAEIGTGDHREGILTKYREAGGALGGVAECFIAARRDVRELL